MANLSQKFDWPDVVDADTYEVVSSAATTNANGGATLLSGPFSVSVSEIPVSTVFAGFVAGTYNVQVRAVNSAGASVYSPSKNFTLDPPGIPESPTVV
jgi:hypothetical protein